MIKLSPMFGFVVLVLPCSLAYSGQHCIFVINCNVLGSSLPRSTSACQPADAAQKAILFRNR